MYSFIAVLVAFTTAAIAPATGQSILSQFSTQLLAQSACPADLNANPTTVTSATEVTLFSKGVRWVGITYLGRTIELHNGALTGEKTFKLKGGIEISTDNPKALYVRFGNCPAIPMQRANYQQLRGRWDYGPKPANDPSCIPGNEGNPLLLNCL